MTSYQTPAGAGPRQLVEGEAGDGLASELDSVEHRLDQYTALLRHGLHALADAVDLPRDDDRTPGSVLAAVGNRLGVDGEQLVRSVLAAMNEEVGEDEKPVSPHAPGEGQGATGDVSVDGFGPTECRCYVFTDGVRTIRSPRCPVHAERDDVCPQAEGSGSGCDECRGHHCTDPCDSCSRTCCPRCEGDRHQDEAEGAGAGEAAAMTLLRELVEGEDHWTPERAEAYQAAKHRARALVARGAAEGGGNR